MTLVQNTNGVLPFSTAVNRVAVLGRLAVDAKLGDHGSSQVFPPAGSERRRGGDRGRSRLPRPSAATAETWDSTPTKSRSSGRSAHSTPRTAVVLIGGNTILLEEWKASVPAIMMAYYLGMEGGTAIARTLFGEVNPRGKLPFVTPKSEADLPAMDWNAEKISYDYYHGYAKLDKEQKPASFPYGFGLSYTTFSLSGTSFAVDGDRLVAAASLKNTGARAGDEVVQLYMGFSRSRVDRPMKVLRGFQRVSLRPGEMKGVSLSCSLAELRWYNPETRRWEREPMRHGVFLGTSSNSKDLIQREVDL